MDTGLVPGISGITWLQALVGGNPDGGSNK